MTRLTQTDEAMQAENQITPGPWKWKGKDLVGPEALVLSCSMAPEPADARLIRLAPLLLACVESRRRLSFDSGFYTVAVDQELEDTAIALIRGTRVPQRCMRVLESLAKGGWVQ